MALSFAAGILIGRTGLGGAALMTPFLILVPGMRADLAIGTDLACVTMAKVAGSWLYWKRSHVDVGLVLKLASTRPSAGRLVRHASAKGPTPCGAWRANAKQREVGIPAWGGGIPAALMSGDLFH